jgi:geranylgeranyl diphosphate synthase type I
MQPFAGRALPELDSLLRELVGSAPATAGFRLLLEYPLGWVTADGALREQPGGKRVRPLLLLLCAEAAGGDWQAALPAAAAVELLHNFSLIHDDIEDASPLRHGRPTVWKQWGVANAINAGDAMFALAYSALARLADTTSDAVALQAWIIFNQMNLDLTLGQHLDMRFETQTGVTTDDYLGMIEGKSAALLAASAQMGALIGGANAQTAEHYRQFGLNLGLAFQIRDDILGVWGDPEVTGKSAATDILARKKALPALYGLAHSDELRALYERDSFDDADVLRAVALLDAAGAREYAAGLEADYHQRALAALEAAHLAGDAARALSGLLDALLGRAA